MWIDRTLVITESLPEPLLLDTSASGSVELCRDGRETAQQQNREVVGETCVGGVLFHGADDGGADRRRGSVAVLAFSAVSSPISSNGLAARVLGFGDAVAVDREQIVRLRSSTWPVGVGRVLEHAERDAAVGQPLAARRRARSSSGGMWPALT